MSVKRSTAQDSTSSIWLVSSSLIAAVGGGLWWLTFRRPSKFLTNKDLPPTVRKDGIEVVRKLDDEERAQVKDAFLSGGDFLWMVAGRDYNKIGSREQYEKQHQSAAYSCLEYVILFSERYGHVLVCRDEDDGTFLGAVGLIPPYKSQRLFTLHFYRTIIPLGTPAVMKMGKEPAARCEAFGQTLPEHKEIMKDIPHWYVQMLGVSRSAQGKGVGRKLMEAAIAMAERDNMVPMYLDCHNDNVPYYEKFGFSVAKQIEIVPKGIEDETTFQMNGMVRGV